MMNNKFDKATDYNITDDPEYMKNLNPLPHEVDIQMEDLYLLALKGKKSSIKRISRLIEKYPKVAMLKNLLSVLHNNLGDSDKAHEVNRVIVEQHPDYLFGLLNLASEYYYNNQYEKMPELLGENFNLKELYPERDTFHFDEVIGMFKMSVMYYSAAGNFEEARQRLDFLKEISAQEDYEQLQLIYLKEMYEHNIEKEKDNIFVEVKPTILKNTIESPNFDIKLVEQLYEYDFGIDFDIIDNLLQSDRSKLINDLNKVLTDSIDRYKYFSDKATDEGYKDEDVSFLLHAIFLLGELEASESLENIFEILSQEYEFIEFYISDILTEYVWIAIYKIAQNKLDACKEFMQRPGIDSFHRSVISEAIMQIVKHQPHRREEVVNWYRDLFQFFLNSSINDNVIDSGLLGMMIADVLEFGAKELMPEIEQLFNKQIVDIFAAGDFDKVKSEMEKSVSTYSKKEILDIHEIYENIHAWELNSLDNDLDYNFDSKPTDDMLLSNESKLDNFIDYEEQPAKQYIRAERKIGRNEPCPCGSGKKYKKCCMNK
jgi:hypothetical protein